MYVTSLSILLSSHIVNLVIQTTIARGHNIHFPSITKYLQKMDGQFHLCIVVDSLVPGFKLYFTSQKREDPSNIASMNQKNKKKNSSINIHFNFFNF